MQISHETIYLSLFIQARGALKHELTEHLRSRRRSRRAQSSTRSGQGRGQIKDKILISERPAEAQDFPKRTAISLSQSELDEVAAQLNARPRKTLGFMTPAEKLAELTGVT